MKQTALQELIAWGDDMLLNHPQKTLSFGEAIDKAVELLEKEKEQIKEAYNCGEYDGIDDFQGDDRAYTDAEHYYNQTYTDDLSDWDATLNDGLEDL